MTSIASGDLAGKTAVDFGSLGSNKDMVFDTVQTDVITVFFVMEIDNAKYACLIGGGDGSVHPCGNVQEIGLLESEKRGTLPGSFLFCYS